MLRPIPVDLEAERQIAELNSLEIRTDCNTVHR